MIVFDASALVALYKHEEGWERVAQEMQSSAISAVNFAETLTRFADIGGDVDSVARDIETSSCEIVQATALHAVLAAQLRLPTRSVGLSLGDRFCLALALERECPVLTADRAWSKVNVGVPIQLIR